MYMGKNRFHLKNFFLVKYLKFNAFDLNDGSFSLFFRHKGIWVSYCRIHVWTESGHVGPPYLFALLFLKLS